MPAGFDGGTLWAANVNFTDPTGILYDHPPTVTTDGQLLIGSTASPNIRVGTLTGSGGIVITAGSGTIDINGSGAGSSFSWQNISASQTLAVKNGYFCSSGGALSLALPAVSSIGDIIEIVLIGSTSFTITQSAGMQITLGNRQTTAGVGGSIASTQQGDAIKIVCYQANTLWVATSSMGNLTIV